MTLSNEAAAAQALRGQIQQNYLAGGTGPLPNYYGVADTAAGCPQPPPLPQTVPPQCPVPPPATGNLCPPPLDLNQVGGVCVGLLFSGVGTGHPTYPPYNGQPQVGGVCAGFFSCIAGSGVGNYSPQVGGVCAGFFSCIAGSGVGAVPSANCPQPPPPPSAGCPTVACSAGCPPPPPLNIGGVCAGFFSCIAGSGVGVAATANCPPPASAGCPSAACPPPPPPSAGCPTVACSAGCPPPPPLNIGGVCAGFFSCIAGSGVGHYAPQVGGVCAGLFSCIAGSGVGTVPPNLEGQPQVVQFQILDNLGAADLARLSATSPAMYNTVFAFVQHLIDRGSLVFPGGYPLRGTMLERDPHRVLRLWGAGAILKQ